MTAVATETVVENPISRYLLEGYTSIEGWLMEGARDMTLALGEVQRAAGVASGPILEIGVWKARYLCLLSFVPAKPGPVIGVDPMVGMADRAGHVRTLREIIGRYCRRPDLFQLVERHSETVSADELIALGGAKFQFISIDGSHLREPVLNDIRLAEATLADGGILAMDDISNPTMPGVWEAFIRYGVEGTGRLEAILNCGNKLFLTQRHRAKAYREALLTFCEQGRAGKVGTRIATFHQATNEAQQPMQLFGQDILVFPGF